MIRQLPGSEKVINATVTKSGPGIAGWLERLASPATMHKVMRAELDELEDHIEQQV